MLSDEVTVTIATGVLTLIGTMFTGIMTYMMARLNKKADRAAVEAREVKETLVHSTKDRNEKLQKITETGRQNKALGESTHMLVNSAMTEQLRINAITLRKLADITKKPEDIAAANEAEAILKDKKCKQENLDATNLVAESK